MPGAERAVDKQGHRRDAPGRALTQLFCNSASSGLALERDRLGSEAIMV
jgi:hypothetical protein